ncbi:heparinase II/III domain-containing protein [Mammaliicoccus lentus]|uniref:heparinase II/III domain-containing protein n=1 Tax=Mammaliicoccus lentus TaxID=42858 RepID=UPI00374E247E
MEINLNKNNIIPLLPYSRHTEDIAKKALNDEIIPFPNFDSVPFNDSIWEFEKDGKKTSYQLYIHSLRVVGELINYYKKTFDTRYLYKGKQIMDSWINFSKTNSTSMTWYDHPTGNRTQVIIELIYYLKADNKDLDLNIYLAQLKKHCEHLENDDNYRPNNHGIMMDKALIMSGLVLSNSNFYLKAKSRLQQTFWLSYSYKGVHLENSPEYHLMVTKMYIELESYLNKNNDSLGKEINNMLNSAKNYLSKIKKPDGNVPAIGDSSEIYIKNDDKMDWENFNDIESGLTIIKDKNHKLYLGFICGYSTITHKHSDDLSIILNYNSKDYFVDSGKLNYSKTPERSYVVSNKAHSSFQLNEKYEKSEMNKYTKEIWTDTYFDTIDYTIVSGFHKKYKETYMRRTIYYIKKFNLVIVRDYGDSEIKKTWISKFNLNENIKVDSSENNITVLQLNDDYIALHCLTNQKLNIINNFDNEIVTNPFISRRANQKINNSQIVFNDENKKNTEYIFCFSFNEKPKIEVEKKDNYLSIFKEGHEIRLPKID